MNLDIQHDKNKHRFYTEVSKKICELKYKKIDDKTLDYYSTFVPKPLRHQGIAGKITAFALRYALSHKYYVIPSCPFVKKYLNNHPEYRAVIK